MKKLLIGLLTLGTLSLHASTLEVNGPLDAIFFKAQVNDEKTYFEKLGDLFKEGTLPKLAKISNIAWSGRCFSHEEPNTPLNGGYIFRKKRTSDVGPLGQNVNAYEAASYWTLSKAPNHYDNLSIEQILRESTRKFSDVRLKADSIEIAVSASDKSNLKVSGNYLIEEISGSDRDIDLDGKTTVGVRCYYFIPDLNY